MIGGFGSFSMTFAICYLPRINCITNIHFHQINTRYLMNQTLHQTYIYLYQTSYNKMKIIIDQFFLKEHYIHPLLYQFIQDTI